MASKLWKYYGKVHGILNAKVAHSRVNFRHVIGPTSELPDKITPLHFTERETLNLLERGERDARRQIQKLRNYPHEEIEARISASYTTRYYNAER